jgi:flagellar assembly protein FliH
LSELRSRVIRGAASAWKPLQVAKLGGGSAGRTARGPRAADAPDAAAHAEAQLDARIAAAFEEGVSEGLYRARAEAQEREKQQVLSAQQRWNGLLDGLARGIGEIEGRLADRLLDLAATVGATIACREIAQARDRIEPVLVETLKLVTGPCRQLEVSAHPTDCAAIDAWLRPQCADTTALAIRADPSIAPGGCVLRADDATLDATLPMRIRRTLAAVGITGAQVDDIVEHASAAPSDGIAPIAGEESAPRDGRQAP